MNTYLEHYGVKGMKWGVRRYQKRDGSLTRSGKKEIYKQLKSVNIAKKYKAMRDAQRAHSDNIEKIYLGKPEGYIKTKEESAKLYRTHKQSVRKTDDYNKTVDKTITNFLKTYGNKRVLETKAMSERGSKEINRLLEKSKKDPKVWNDNIESVRRAHAYEDEKRLNDLKTRIDVNGTISKLYKEEYGKTVYPSNNTKDSDKRYEKFLERQVKKNKKNGHY